jgi:hypothetical protein
MSWLEFLLKIGDRVDVRGVQVSFLEKFRDINFVCYACALDKAEIIHVLRQEAKLNMNRVL